MSFVTTRNKLGTKSNSMNDVSMLTNDSTDSDITQLDSTIKSLPNNSIDSEEVVELKLKMDQLVLELDGAHLEIENLCSENNSLKQELSNCKKTIDTLKRVALSGPQTPTPLKNKNKVNSRVKVKKHNITKLTSFTSDTLCSTPEFEEDENNVDKYNINKITRSESKDRIVNLDDTTTQLFTNKTLNVTAGEISELVQQQTKNTQEIKGNRRTRLSKDKQLCLISSSKKHNIIQNTEESFGEFNYCHYLVPDGGIKELLMGIESKLKHFTMSDFCVLLIGESDFRITKDYYVLVNSIRLALQSVQHTNIIVCVPTFKCNGMSLLFNERVEQFNNVLYEDNKLNKYAFIFDSNRKLEYTSKMFNINTGTINKFGLQTLFTAVNAFIGSILRQYRKEIKCEPKRGTIPYYFKLAKTDKSRNHSFR